MSLGMSLQRLKFIDENNTKDLERSATRVRTSTVDQLRGVHGSPSNQIKLAAIYDDEAEIIKILSLMKENKKGWLQSIRGQCR